MRVKIFDNKKADWMEMKERKKRPVMGLFCIGGRGSIKLSIEIKKDALEVGFVENLLVFGSAKKESGAANIVDKTGNALGVVVKGGDKGVGEKLAVRKGSDPEMVFDVRGGFFEVEGRKGVTDSDALIESLVGGETKFGGQIGLTNQDESEERIGIEIVVEEETKLVKEFRRQQMSLVDDQEGIAIFAGQVLEGVV